jgi:K+-transporting ATPase KdpF subunit
MKASDVLGLVIAVALIIYLTWAMLRGEQL